MPNQFETHTSDVGTTIHLKMNGENLENLIIWDRVIVTTYDIFLYVLLLKHIQKMKGFKYLLYYYYFYYFFSTSTMNIEKINDGLRMPRKHFLFPKIIFAFPKTALGKIC